MACLSEYIFFVFSILYLFLIYEYIFIDPLHGVQLPTVLIYHQEDFPKRPFINDLNYLEIVQLGLSFSPGKLHQTLRYALILKLLLPVKLLPFVILCQVDRYNSTLSSQQLIQIYCLSLTSSRRYDLRL